MGILAFVHHVPYLHSYVTWQANLQYHVAYPAACFRV